MFYITLLESGPLATVEVRNTLPSVRLLRWSADDNNGGTLAMMARYSELGFGKILYLDGNENRRRETRGGRLRRREEDGRQPLFFLSCVNKPVGLFVEGPHRRYSHHAPYLL